MNVYKNKELYNRFKYSFENNAEIRGDNNILGIKKYAIYILQKINPPKGSVILDVGCGDGLVTKEIKILRPDLKIYGLEVADNLSKLAKKNNPGITMFSGFITDIDFRKLKFDIIYSFSVMQYIKEEDLKLNNEILFKALKQNGKIYHLSIPNIRMYFAFILVDYLNRFGFLSYILSPISYVLNKVKFKNTYFGNNGFCMKRERLDLSNLTKPCDQQYDKYEGVEELLPFAKGISAKSHEFDEKGNDINTDFEKMIAIIKQSSYEGYIAIEYEGAMLNLFGGKGNYLNPHEGVIATKALLEKLI